MLKRY